MKPKHIIVGLSGGVDSAVSAWLLKQQGHNVQGLFMKNWEREDYTVPCTAQQDLKDVRLVCETLGIVLHTANFSLEYWRDVFTHFLQEYKACRTPNPDILCNKMIKFRVFLDYAQQLGADAIATGHYARSARVGNQYQLKTAADGNKDQTYFLYTLGQDQLAHILFPLSDLTKPAVRQLAADIGLTNHAKKDSVGICFIGKRHFKNFLQRYLTPNPGPIKTLDHRTIGQHEGLMYYTIGQRRGLHIGGQAGHPMSPWYVVAKEKEHNILRVVQGHKHPALYATRLHCSQVSWVAGHPPTLPLDCFAKTRHGQAYAACTLVTLHGTSTYQVLFKQPERAVCEGQAIVFYKDATCLGGGTIQSVYNELSY